MSRSTRIARLLRWGSAVLVALGVLVVLTAHLWRKADAELRDQWQQQAHAVLPALPPEVFDSLTGTAADVSNPDYERLKARLISLRESIPDCRFVYLMGRRADGMVFFYADSEPADSPDLSLPGDEYPDYDPELAAVLEDRQSAVSGPYDDSFGRWVSAYAVVLDTQSSTGSIVLGLDIDARLWSLRILLQLLPTFGVVSLVFFTCGLLAYVFRRRSSASFRRAESRSALLMLGLSPVFSVAILVLLATGLWQRQLDLQDMQRDSTRFSVQFEKIGALDAQLTDIALLAAYSLDPSWVEAYNRLGPELDNLLVVKRTRVDLAMAALLKRLEEVNLALTEREERAFEFIAKGDSPSALGVLTSPEYGGLKTKFTQALGDLQTAMKGEIAELEEAFDEQARRNRLFLAAAIFIVVASWIVIARVLRERDRAEVRGLQILTDTAIELEQTVAKRTSELAKSERRQRMLFETMAQGVVIQDATGNIIEANKSAERILGLTQDQLLGLTSMDPRWACTDLDGRPLSGDKHPSSIARQTRRAVLGVTHSVHLPSGEMRWLLVDSVPVFENDRPDAAVLHTHTIFSDITEQRAAEHAREAQRRYLEFIIESDISGYWEWDMKTDRLMLSPAFHRLLGYEPGTLAGGSDLLKAHMHEGDLAESDAKLSRHIDTRGKEPFYQEVRWRHRDGTWRWFICSGGVVGWAEDGSALRIVGSHIDITHAKASEVSLRETNQRLAAAMAQAERLSLVATHTTNAVVFTDVQRRITWVNEGFTRITGYTLEEVLGRSPGSFLQSSSTDPATRAAMRGALERVEPIKCELVNRNKVGEDYWLTIEIVPLRDGAGVHSGFLAIQADITERKVAEMMIAEQAQRTEFALAAGDLGLWDWHIPSGRVLFDQRWAGMLGEDRDALTPHIDTWTERCHPDDLPICQSALVAHFRGETPLYECRQRLRHRDGSWRVIMDKGRVVERDAEGRAVRMVGTHADITDTAKTQLELERRASALAHVGRLARVGDWELDVDTGVLHWSDQVRQIHEVGADYQPTIATWRGFFAPEDVPRLDALFEAAMKQGDAFDLELAFVTERGASLCVRMVGESVRKEGMITLVRGVLQDVTEARRQREAFAAARDAAEAATRAKSEFLANMSHEIRTPLNGVVGLTHLLLDTNLDKIQHRYAQGIQVSSQSLLHLINDILDFSKIEAGKFELSPHDFDLHANLRGIIEPYELQARAKGLQLRLHLSPDTPRWVRGDSKRLGQIVQNLLSNAIKFTAQGEVELMLSPVPEKGEDGVLRFAVRDTGMGILLDKQRALFQKFSQVDASITRSFGGTGLGLAISKELSMRMRGEIGVESVAGQGATFWFTASLPIVPEPAQEDAQAVRGGWVELPPWLRVLLVEDNLTNQQVALGLLGKFGVQARVANNGREAIDLLEQEDFDCVLMDLQMPVMDGLTATRIIRDPASAVHSDDLPVIGMTAHALMGDREIGLAAGLSDYITKPIDPAALRAALARAASRKQTAEPPPAIAAPPAERLPSETPAPRSESPVREAPPPASSAPLRMVLNLEDLKARMMGSDRLMQAVLLSFARELDSMLAQLQTALQAGDYVSLGRHAHSLKGASANIGADELRDTARALEEALREGFHAQAPALLPPILAAAEALRPHLPPLG